MPQGAQENVYTDRGSSYSAAPTATSSVVVAAKASRVSILIYNNGAGTVYLSLNDVATTTDDLPLVAGGSFYDNEYVGAVHARTASGTGDLRMWDVG